MQSELCRELTEGYKKGVAFSAAYKQIFKNLRSGSVYTFGFM